MVDTSNYYKAKLNNFAPTNYTVELKEPLSRSLLQLTKIYLGAFSKRVDHLDINRYHFILLMIAEYDGMLTQKQLAAIAGKDKSSMVSIIDSLTEKGYVYREINPADRREQLIKITEKARYDIPVIRESYEVLNKMATEGITNQQLDIFNNVLKQMAANLQPHIATDIKFHLKKTLPAKRKN
jgi:MarR family transcriptional regulator for hemolysin